jgi:hypothetical protein
VILSWDPAARVLEYVAVNGGAGGPAERIGVSADEAADIAAQLAGRELPRVAELEAEDGIVLLGDVTDAEVVRCAVSAVGMPGDRRFKITDKERESLIASLPIADLGVPDAMQAPAANELEYLYTEQLTPPGCWLGCAGGIGTWLAARRPQESAKQRAARERNDRKRDENRRAQAGTRFVNPYTFVPFPPVIERGVPGGHHRLGPGRLSGSFTVTWTFTTPFQAPDGTSVQAPDGTSGTALLRLPGASVKGAVRSVHETLAGGCLRVFDADFIPSYRDHAQVKNPSWKLAVVEKATADGQPLSVLVCDEVVWAGVAQLRRACGDALSSGDRVTIQDADAAAARVNLGRRELDKSAVVTGGGDWVVLVTDSGTRRDKIRTPAGEERDGAYLLACGRLGSQVAEVTEAAWRGFQIAAAGTRDMQAAKRSSLRGETGDDPADRQLKARVMLDSRRPGSRSKPIGYRRVVTGRLWEGDVVWARIEADGGGEDGSGEHSGSGTVAELSLAALWRHPGWESAERSAHEPEKWSAGSRVPP